MGLYLLPNFQQTHRRDGGCLTSIVPPNFEILGNDASAIVVNPEVIADEIDVAIILRMLMMNDNVKIP